MGVSGRSLRACQWRSLLLPSLVWVMTSSCGGQANTATGPVESNSGGNSSPASSGGRQASGGVPGSSGGQPVSSGGMSIFVPPGDGSSTTGGAGGDSATCAPSITGIATVPTRQCSNPRPIGGGFVECGEGSYRRPEISECETTVPRPDPDGVCHSEDECCHDSDCPGPYPYCSWGRCTPGCLSDADCPEQSVCVCGDPIGRCVSASCTSDADCPPDFPCSAGTFFHGGFACQSPCDQCLLDSDCRAGSLGQCSLPGADLGRYCLILPG